MIAHVEGTIVEKFTGQIIVDVHGVGYEVNLSTIDFEEINVGETKKFYTYHAVRETSEDLYGFTTLMAKKIFEMLISVNGIGPKAGMAILSLGTPEEVRNAIANAVDLKDKVGLPSRYTGAEIQTKKPENNEALDALMVLGFNLKEATEALKEIDADLPVEDQIRLALKNR